MPRGLALLVVERLWRSCLGLLGFRLDRRKQQRVEKLQRDDVEGRPQLRRNLRRRHALKVE